MKINQYGRYLIKWISDYIINAKKDGVVFGVSGGIDSSLCLALCLKNKKIINPEFYFLDIDSSDQDYKCTKLLEKKFKVKIPKLNLSPIYKKYVSSLKLTNKLSMSNLKPRIRMATLYAIAQQKNKLVLGTSNADEIYLGYFTKHGDGANDLAPLANLTKKHIKELANLYDLPTEIINRKPTAGLYKNQNDEDELKVSYDIVDNYLMNKKIKLKDEKRIKYLHNIAKHKLGFMNKPKAFINLKKD